MYDKEEKFSNDELNRDLPFYDKLIQNATLFAENTLSQAPELEAMAIVFRYVLPGHELPLAIVMGQQGNLSSSNELSNMIYQLGQTQQILIRQLEDFVVGVDESLRMKTELLVKLNSEIAFAEKQRSRNSP